MLSRRDTATITLAASSRRRGEVDGGFRQRDQGLVGLLLLLRGLQSPNRVQRHPTGKCSSNFKNKLA